MGRESTRVELDLDDLFKQVMDTDQVVGGTEQQAVKIAARARQITLREGGEAVIDVRRRYHVNGRASYDVVSESDEEYGTSEKKRIRALRRAAREVK